VGTPSTSGVIVFRFSISISRLSQCLISAANAKR
jgi:hypothetical protein